jgi:hypothetical protein
MKFIKNLVWLCRNSISEVRRIRMGDRGETGPMGMIGEPGVTRGELKSFLKVFRKIMTEGGNE